MITFVLKSGIDNLTQTADEVSTTCKNNSLAYKPMVFIQIYFSHFLNENLLVGILICTFNVGPFSERHSPIRKSSQTKSWHAVAICGEHTYDVHG